MTKPQDHVFRAERLEGRILLAAALDSLAIGNVLYQSEAAGTGFDLYRSQLDGGGRQLLGHWATHWAGPNHFYPCDGKLLFTANYQGDAYTGAELWASDGTAAGTKMVVDLYESAAGSDPRQFHTVNGHVLFVADRNSAYNPQLYATDGTTAGTRGISPWARDGYSGAVRNVQFSADQVSWDHYRGSYYQRLSSDGTPTYRVEYTEPTEGVLRFTGNPSIAQIITVTKTAGGTYRVSTGGDVLDFRVQDVTSIEVIDGFKDDVVTLDSDITVPVTFSTLGGNDTLTGGGGVNTLQAAGHFATYVDAEGITQGRAAAAVTLTREGGSATFINGDHLELHGAFTHVIGSSGNDTLIGTDRAETLEGGAGNDSIVGNGGGDQIDGGGGRDSITANRSRDAIVADAADRIVDTDPALPPNPDADQESHATYSFRDGVLRITGTVGNDNLKLIGSANSIKLMLNGTTAKVLAARVNRIIVYGGAGDDVIQIRSVAVPSKLYGDGGDDAITGSAGKDRIYGGDGDDSLAGGDNRDTLYGEAGDDRMAGGNSRDFLSGGAGTNVLRGEASLDRIVFTGLDDVRGNRGDRMDLNSFAG